MGVAENTSKNGIVKVIRNLGYPFFCWVERYNEVMIKLQAGCISQFKQPTFMVEGIFCVKDFLRELQTFADSAKEEAMIYEAFEDLDKRNSEDDNEKK